MFLLQCQKSLSTSIPRPVLTSMPKFHFSQMIIDTNWQQTQLHQSAQTSYLEDEQLTIPLNQCLCFLHFRKQVGITNDPSCISYFTTSLVQPRNDPHNGSFGDISQLDDFREWLVISFILYQEGDIPFPQPTRTQPRPIQLYTSP